MSLLLAAMCGVFAVCDPAGPGGRDTVAVGDSAAIRDTAAVRAAAAAHFAVPDSAVQKRVTILADTAWAIVYHGRITFTIIRLRRTSYGWRFERDMGYGIH